MSSSFLQLIECDVVLKNILWWLQGLHDIMLSGTCWRVRNRIRELFRKMRFVYPGKLAQDDVVRLMIKMTYDPVAERVITKTMRGGRSMCFVDLMHSGTCYMAYHGRVEMVKEIMQKSIKPVASDITESNLVGAVILLDYFDGDYMMLLHMAAVGGPDGLGDHLLDRYPQHYDGKISGRTLCQASHSKDDALFRRILDRGALFSWYTALYYAWQYFGRSVEVIRISKLIPTNPGPSPDAPGQDTATLDVYCNGMSGPTLDHLKFICEHTLIPIVSSIQSGILDYVQMAIVAEQLENYALSGAFRKRP